MTWASAIIIAALLVSAPCHAGEIAYDFSPPVTSDSTCGAKDAPLTDFDHYRVVLYRCVSDSLVRRSPPDSSYWIARRDSIVFNLPSSTDSVRFTVLDGIVGYTQVWAVDTHGNVSCDYLSDVWATKAVAAPPPPPPPPPSDGTGIVGRYYRDLNRGAFVASRRDSTISFKWALDAPMAGVPADSFSVEWDGEVYIPETGAWTFCVESEDGASGYIDWTYQFGTYGTLGLTERCVTANLTAGWHGLHLNYMARLGNAQIKVTYAGPGVSKRIIPREALR